jgi:hypothetical protein
MKTTHKHAPEITPTGVDVQHQITLEGRVEEFEGILSALDNCHDNKVQQLSAFIRKALNK